jgi:tetratricopeptide (TPR) repeat protein
MLKRAKAAKLNERANQLEESGRAKEAVALYQKAGAADATWSVPLYNLGLLFKKARRWRESLHYNRLATELDAKSEGAWWNLGIAATALGRWNLARAAWRGFGINLPEGQGPVDFPCGFCPVRLDPNGHAEVVWAQRIDPARATLASIPFPDSNHHWRDIVLNDGAPNGYRKYNGKEVPVFDALELLEPSAFATFVANVKMPADQKYIQKLTDLASEMGGSAEDWSTSVRLICKACSEGRPHELHDTESKPPAGLHSIAIAARDRSHARDILSSWEGALKRVHVQSLDDGS